MTDETYNGYTNWESFAFSAWWTNDEAMMNDFIEKAAGGWLEHKGNPVEIGRVLVGYAREHYAGKGTFTDFDTEEEWEAIDLAEAGEEMRDLIAGHDRYAYLMEDED